MSNKLYLTMGAPGSGKSTFIMDHLNGQIWVSRDNVRFAMVKEDEEYFSKEKEVYREFVKEINTALQNGNDVFADATHLNKASRHKLLRAIDPKLDLEIDIIWIKTPLDECIKRNENRKGTRSYVPESAIRNMYNNIEKPEFEEGFNVIYVVEDGKSIQIFKED